MAEHTESELAAFLAAHDNGEGTEYAAALRHMVSKARADGFDAGLQLGARVEQRAARDAIASAALTVLGKDAGDGEIDLGALGAYGVGDDGWERRAV